MTPGHDRLWRWFGLSRASFITMPRVLAHAMPDEWQDRMAALLEEYDEAFPGAYGSDMPTPYVTFRRDRKFTKAPEWLLNYRYPDQTAIGALRARQHPSNATASKP